MNNFSERLRGEMHAAGLTQAALATKCGVGQSRVSDWLKGKSAPQPRTLYAIARSLGVTEKWLLEGTEPKLNKESERIGEQIFWNLPIPDNLGGVREESADDPTPSDWQEIGTHCITISRSFAAISKICFRMQAHGQQSQKPSTEK